MILRRKSPIVGVAALLCGLGIGGAARAQGPGSPSGPSIASINADYDRELAKLEGTRLDRLGELASRQEGAEADATYEAYFRLAIARGLYDRAEPLAEKLIASGHAGPRAAWLAHVVKIVAEADRGAYEDSLRSLAESLRLTAEAQGRPGPRSELPRAARLGLVDAYYQRLNRADKPEVARKAMLLIRDRAEDPAVKALAGHHLDRLDLIGRPAPPLAGDDLDGRPVRLPDDKGEVVLVVFWATWCIPNAQEIPLLDKVYASFKDRGFRIVGVNLDAAEGPGEDVRSVAPNVRRFLLANNVPWPTLIGGPGERDYARAYAVTAIPANALIGRDGRVLRVDLAGSNLEKAVAEAVGRR